eukprot:6204811-Pleurochrysis_carterae.AAC.2
MQVFVGNLPFETTWQELKEHMKQAGDVAHADINQTADGRSKGSGLVRYVKEEDAEWAVENLTETDCGGRNIFVRADRGGGRGGGVGKGRGFGGKGRGSGRGKGSGRGGKGKGGKGAGRGGRGQKRTTAADLDSDLDAYMTGEGAPEQMKKKVYNNLDDDLDAYFSQARRAHSPIQDGEMMLGFTTHQG